MEPTAACSPWRRRLAGDCRRLLQQLGAPQPAPPEPIPSYRQSAGDLAELLGLHHDFAVLDDLLAANPGALGIDLDVAFAREAAAGRQEQLEAKIAALGLQVFAETPKALKARFSAYLEGWLQREAAE